MKTYSNTKAHKIRLAIRAFVDRPESNPGDIAAVARVARNTAARYIDTIRMLGGDPRQYLTLPDSELVSLITPGRRTSARHPFDFLLVIKQLKLGFKRKQCHKMYMAAVPDGLRPMKCRTFCHDLRELMKAQEPAMKMIFRAGDVMMADYAGDTPSAIDPTGESRPYTIFVSTLACSQLIYAMIHEGQRIEDWLDGLTESVHFFRGVPRRVIPDNPKAMVLQPRRGNVPAIIHPCLIMWGDHYQCLPDPARPGAPRDKALVENAVRLIQDRLMPEVRSRDILYLHELRSLLAGIVDEINRTPMEGREKKSRFEWFAETDALELKPITAEKFRYISGDTIQLVTKQYRVNFETNTYSVPWENIGKEAHVRATRTIVEIYVGGLMVANHRRNRGSNRDTVDPMHMPENHRAIHFSDEQNIAAWAAALGPDVKAVCDFNIAAPSVGASRIQRLAGLQRLERDFGVNRLKTACALAVARGHLEYRTLKNMLENGRECDPVVPSILQARAATTTANVRGPAYYAREAQS